MSITSIYTDGSGKDGIAGWGVRAEHSDGTIFRAAGNLGPGTNNRGELKGYIVGMQWMLDNNVDKCVFYIDSKYVIDNRLATLKGWMNNSWITSQGTEVKNKDLWIQVNDLQTKLAEKKLRFKTTWVKGHSGNPGNEDADKLALRGVLQYHSNLPDFYSDKEDEVSAPTTKFKHERLHPMLYGTYGLMVTGKEEELKESALKLGYPHAHLMCRYTDSDDKRGTYLARPSSSAVYGLILTHRETKILSLVRKTQEEIADKNYHIPCQLHYGRIGNKGVQEQIHKDGEICLQSNGGCVTVWGTDRLTEYMQPALLSSYAVKELGKLVIHMSELDDKYILSIDITDKVYIKDSKGNQKVSFTKDKDPIVVDVELSGLKGKIRLFPSVNIPPKNELNRLAKEEGEVKVSVRVMERERGFFDFWTLIETKESVGIYKSAFSTNLVI